MDMIIILWKKNMIQIESFNYIQNYIQIYSVITIIKFSEYVLNK